MPPDTQITSKGNEMLCQEVNEQLSVQPCTRTRRILFGQVAEPKKGLHSFERQLNLPGQPIHL